MDGPTPFYAQFWEVFVLRTNKFECSVEKQVVSPATRGRQPVHSKLDN